MRKIAVIPLRAGSKGIVGKNKKKIVGRALYQWVLTEAVFSELDEIYVFTDDQDIITQVEREYTWTDKITCVFRSEKSATDTASTEYGLLELTEKIKYNFDILCLLQATSPLTKRTDINACLDKIIDSKHDSCLTVVEKKRFIWSESGESLNYNYLKRPRRQDFSGLLVENGAVYAINKIKFLETKNRLGGKIGVVKMDEITLTEIDEPSDWVIMEHLLEEQLLRQKRKSKEIKVVVFDVDGVFTDATVAVSAEGELFKQFSLRDGMGFELLKQEGIIPVIMTSEDSQIVKKRMEKLQLDHVYLGVKDKFSRLEFVLNHMGINRNEVAYLGDDINDQSNLASCGWGLCPLDGEDVVKNVSDIVLTKKGGDRVIREAIKQIIKLNKKR